jgi:DNA-binding NarL/FixJ family response regulator
MSLIPLEPAPHSDHDPLQVWLIEDNSAYRESLTRAVTLITPADDVRAFGNCEVALEDLARLEAPHVLLLDIGLPGMSGLEGLERFKSLAPAMLIIMVTSFDDHDRIFKAICAGASGYLLKSAPLAEITEAIRQVLRGGAPMSPQVASSVLRILGQMGQTKPATAEYGLSPRERETLEAMVHGITLKEIAHRMDISHHTVDTYVRNIYSKLHVRSRGGAVAKALRERLL